jgi:hypothetical protein
LGSFGDGSYMGVRLEEFADAAAEDACAVAVDDADSLEAGEEGAVKILLQLLRSFVHSAADEVDLHAQGVSVGAGDGDVNILLLASGGKRVGFSSCGRL